MDVLCRKWKRRFSYCDKASGNILRVAEAKIVVGCVCINIYADKHSIESQKMRKRTLFFAIHIQKVNGVYIYIAFVNGFQKLLLVQALLTFLFQTINIHIFPFILLRMKKVTVIETGQPFYWDDLLSMQLFVKGFK